MIYTILMNHYDLDDIGDSLTLSRVANKNFSEYDTIISRINNSKNSCVKLNPNDFIDLKNQCVNYDYKKVDFASFDKIVFVTRENYLDAVLSYAYMNPGDRASWHRVKGQEKIGQPYTIDPVKLFYLYRGYFLFDKIKQYICQQVDSSKIYQYEYETVERDLMRDFELSSDDLDIPLVPNNLDYTVLATNYAQIVELASKVYQRMAELDINELDNAQSFFWCNEITQ